MKYQLVLQWPESSIEDYDALIEIEDRLISCLAVSAEVDRHDAGSGEVNIFIRTNDPQRAFEEIRSALDRSEVWPDIRVAYRDLEANRYTVLWPKGLATFQVT